MNHQILKEQALLRRYLKENKVCASVASNIWEFLKSDKGSIRPKLHEVDVKILQKLPRTLRDELQDEIYTPVITKHPFFYNFTFEFPQLLRKTFRCIRESALSFERELFAPGERAEHMYFLVTGGMRYQPNMETEAPRDRCTVGPAEWVCEPALWVSWRHRGSMIAAMQSELITLQTDKFHKAMADDLTACRSVIRYAQLFAERAEDHVLEYGDLPLEHAFLEELAQCAFSEDY
jgi:hypothetical protein